MNADTPPTVSPRSLRRLGVGLVVAAVVIVGWNLISARQARARLVETTEAQAVVTVATTKPQPMTDTSALTLPGSVQARTDAPIYARTSGYLKSWQVDIGAQVKAGDTLAEIDAPELDQQLRAAEAQVANADAAQKLARITADRWKGLRDSDSVSKQAADEKLSLAETAAAELNAARANQQRLRELSGFKRIVAPFDGVVTARNTDVGQLISAGGGAGPELFRIADTKQLRLYVRVPQAYAAQMKVGLEAEVRFPDRPGVAVPAHLARTSSALESSSRTLLAELAVDNTKGELLPGAYAEVKFTLPAGSANTFKVPANTLLAANEGLQIGTVGGDGKVVMKPVTVGRDFGGDVEIVNGLAASDEVILSPPDSLTAETRIRVAKPQEATAPSAAAAPR